MDQPAIFLIQRQYTAPGGSSTLSLNVTVVAAGNFFQIQEGRGSSTSFRFPSNPFLNPRKGIYSGVNTPIQFQMGTNWMYLNRISVDSSTNVGTYQASPTPGQMALGIQLQIALGVQSIPVNSSWGGYPPRDLALTFYNPQVNEVSADLTLSATIVTPVNTRSQNRLIYSTAECTQIQSCQYCGGVGCPANFLCTVGGGICTSTINNLAMGLRVTTTEPNQIYVLSYFINADNTIDVRFVALENIRSNPPTQENWFFLNGVSPNTVLQVGQTYPLTVQVPNSQNVGGQTTSDLRFLTNPMITGTFGNEYVKYTLTTNSTNAAAFKPTRTGNWREQTFRQGDFEGFTFPTITPAENPVATIALWQNSILAGMPAVSVQGGSGGNGGNGGGGRGNGNGFVELTPSKKQTIKPIWEEWWFWLIIIAILLLVFVGGFMLYHSHHRAVTNPALK